MKVVLINTEENKGGAAIACKRLLNALNRIDGVEANLLVRTKRTDHPFVTGVAHSFLQKLRAKFYFVWERFTIFYVNRFTKKNLFAISLANTGFDLSKHPLVKAADVIHLHWINQGFLSVKNIRQLIALGKPIVWTMHDMWPLTGICHHARVCNAYTEACGDCFFLTKPHAKDISAQVFAHKRKVYKNTSIQFVTCSDWLRRLGEQSELMQKNEIITIPNPIDIYFFTTSNSNEARQKLGLPLDKKLVLFGAVNVTDPRKGISYFCNALNLLWEKHPHWREEMEVVIFGDMRNHPEFPIPFRQISLGYIPDAEKMRTIYQAVDLYVTSSLEENLPNTIMEALSCGSPSVAYRVGGIPEMIDHLDTGYLAQYQSIEDLTTGIDSMLQIDYEEQTMRCRKAAISRYSEDLIAGRYLSLYNRKTNKRRE